MRALLIPAAFVALALPAAAQAPTAPAAQPVHLRGKVVSLEGNTLTIAKREGGNAVVNLPPTWSVAVVKAIKAEDIKAGSFIGTTEKPTGEGAGSSLEVHVFPPGVKMGEGHYPWDLEPGSTMTNGTVDTVVTGVSGRELTVSYKGGSRKVTVPANAPIVSFAMGAHDLVKPGASVFVIAAPKPDGSFAAGSVTVGDGATPPPM
jgi:hypothetical protein